MTERLVSVVIPTYNDDPVHLHEAVASALSQKGPHPVEVVLVDDGSTRSETVAAVDELGSPNRVRVIRQENGGPAAAINAGIGAAGGEYVLTLGGDDRLSESFVASCMEVMAPDVAFAYSRVHFFFEDGRVEPQPEPPAELGLAGFMGGNRASAVALFRRSDWERVGGFIDGMALFEDWTFWVQLLRSEPGLRAVNAPGAFLEYRQREGSRSSFMSFEERMRATREAMVATDEVEVLRRMLLSSWERYDEVIDELAAERAAREGGPIRHALRRAWRTALPAAVRDRL
ncbi:glycosyltransferase [Georgenia muralis]